MKVKKVGALALAAVMITMSGVAATWIYAEMPASAIQQNITVAIKEWGETELPEEDKNKK